MAAVSWQMGCGSNLDLAANKNVLVRTNSNSMKKKRVGIFLLLLFSVVLGGPLHLSSASALLSSRLLPSLPY